MKIGIDLTWVKPNKNGGTEFYIRNLMDGFKEINNDNYYILFVANDNKDSFKHYLHDSRFKFYNCNLDANNLPKRIIWKNLFLYKKMVSQNLDIAFFPVYDMPITKCKKLKTATTIHDIQALHYPKYFSKLEYAILMYTWKKTVQHSDKVIAISKYVQDDIKSNFQNNNNITYIHNPIVLNKEELLPFNQISKQFSIEDNNYYYTVSSLLPHKNLMTLVKMMKYIISNNINLPNKLLISGVGGKQNNELVNYIHDNNLENNIILTGFIDNTIRNTLIKHSQCFLFSSIFEGFGMPPIEAMILGTNVLSTKKTSLKEVTKGKCYYVDDPFNINEWILQLEKIKFSPKKQIAFDEYNKESIAKQYLNLFEEIISK